MDDLVRIYVDADGVPVDDGDPRVARVLVGPDAEAALKRRRAETEDKRRKVKAEDKADAADAG
jgi:uncharacterized membrane protein